MKPHPSDLAAVQAETPRIERKWTRINDEWVQVYREIIRGPGGLSDRPATTATITGAK